MSDIFLSHNHEDKRFVFRLASDLALFGVKAWVDEFEINPGDSLIEKIEGGMNSSRYIGAVISENSIASNWVKRELRTAITQEIENNTVVVVPLLLDKCDIPVFLRDKLYLDFGLNYDKSFAKLLKRLLEKPLPESSDDQLILEYREIGAYRSYGIDDFTKFILSKKNQIKKETLEAQKETLEAQKRRSDTGPLLDELKSTRNIDREISLCWELANYYSCVTSCKDFDEPGWTCGDSLILLDKLRSEINADHNNKYDGILASMGSSLSSRLMLAERFMLGYTCGDH